MCDNCAILAPVQAVPFRLLTGDAPVVRVRNSDLSGIVASFSLLFPAIFQIYLTELQ